MVTQILRDMVGSRVFRDSANIWSRNPRRCRGHADLGTGARAADVRRMSPGARLIKLKVARRSLVAPGRPVRSRRGPLNNERDAPRVALSARAHLAAAPRRKSTPTRQDARRSCRAETNESLRYFYLPPPLLGQVHHRNRGPLARRSTDVAEFRSKLAIGK